MATITGGSGLDTLTAGNGDDVYQPKTFGDTINEAPGGGTDQVEAPFDFTLPANVENLALVNAAGMIQLSDGGGNFRMAAVSDPSSSIVGSWYFSDDHALV